MFAKNHLGYVCMPPDPSTGNPCGNDFEVVKAAPSNADRDSVAAAPGDDLRRVRLTIYDVGAIRAPDWWPT